MWKKWITSKGGQSGCQTHLWPFFTHPFLLWLSKCKFTAVYQWPSLSNGRCAALSLSFILVKLVLSCQLNTYCSCSIHSQPWHDFFKGYNTEWMMGDCSLDVSSHWTPMSSNDRKDSPHSGLSFTWILNEGWGTDSLLTFTPSTLERLSGHTGCDEWLHSDILSWLVQKTE